VRIKTSKSQAVTLRCKNFPGRSISGVELCAMAVTKRASIRAFDQEVEAAAG